MKMMPGRTPMTRSTLRWIRRHDRRHGSVVIVKDARCAPLDGSLDQDSIVECVVVATARCACGQSRRAYVERTLGFDGARAPR